MTIHDEWDDYRAARVAEEIADLRANWIFNDAHWLLKEAALRYGYDLSAARVSEAALVVLERLMELTGKPYVELVAEVIDQYDYARFGGYL